VFYALIIYEKIVFKDIFSGFPGFAPIRSSDKVFLKIFSTKQKDWCQLLWRFSKKGKFLFVMIFSIKFMKFNNTFAIEKFFYYLPNTFKWINSFSWEAREIITRVKIFNRFPSKNLQTSKYFHSSSKGRWKRFSYFLTFFKTTQFCLLHNQMQF